MLYVLAVEITIWCARIASIFDHIVALNHSYDLASVERPRGVIEPGRSPARIDYIYIPGEARLG